MLVDAFRWAMGYLKFEVHGGIPEKIINFSVKNQIKIWDIKKLDDGISAKSSIKEFNLLEKFAKNNGMQTNIIVKYGLPLKIKKIENRKGVLGGILIFFTVLYFLSSYIWNIEVLGNKNVSREDVINAAAKCGLFCGAIKKRVNAEYARQGIMMNLPDIAWMSININGSQASILIKERVCSPDIAVEGKPCDIKAKCDGKIERVETYCGNAVINAGDAVLKGQILISGVNEDYEGKNSFVCSEGKVIALTKREIRETVPLSREKLVDSGRIKNKYRIKIFGLEIPFGFWYKIGDMYRSEFYSNRMHIDKIILPITIYNERWYQQNLITENIEYSQALEEAKKNTEERELDELKEVKILEKVSIEEESDGNCVLITNYHCLEDIGVKEEIIIDQH